MRRFFKREIKKGMPISVDGFAKGINGIASALEEMEIVGGHIEWSVGNVPKLIIDGGSSDWGYAQPFDITFDEADFTLSNCVARRGPVTKDLGSIEGTVSSDGTHYIAAWVHSGTYEAMAQVGASIASVTDVAVNVDSAWYKVLLYKAERETDGDVVTVRVLVDYREGAGIFLYV